MNLKELKVGQTSVVSSSSHPVIFQKNEVAPLIAAFPNSNLVEEMVRLIEGEIGGYIEKNFGEAISRLKQAIKVRTSKSEAWNNIGKAAAELKSKGYNIKVPTIF